MRRLLTVLILLTALFTCANCRRHSESAAIDPTPQITETLPNDRSSASASAQSGGASETPGAAPAPSLPPCARIETRVNLPADFPKNVPTPPGTVFTASKRTDRGIIMEGMIPLDLTPAVRFFLPKFAAAGFIVGRGEVEEGEAEAPFRGNGLLGAFKLRRITDCPGASSLYLIVQSMPPRPSATPSTSPAASGSALP